MEFGKYYKTRFKWIVTFTSKNFFYILAKILCIVIGLPLYCVMFVVEMIATALYVVFALIPVVNVVVMVLSKIIIRFCGLFFYFAVLPDIKSYLAYEKALEVDNSDLDEFVITDYEVDNDESLQESATNLENILENNADTNSQSGDLKYEDSCTKVEVDATNTQVEENSEEITEE